MNLTEQGKKMGQIVAKAWTDEAFKNALLTDANAVLKAEGIQVPAGVMLRVMENTDTAMYFVLPARPKTALSDADLVNVGGGSAKYMCLECTGSNEIKL